MISSSHLDKLETSLNGRILKFNFKNIQLPDSTASQGFVTFSIKANNNIVPYTAVKNTAGIYFESNPAVVTNTTSNLMVNSIPTTQIETVTFNNKIKVFPNPSKGLAKKSRAR